MQVKDTLALQKLSERLHNPETQIDNGTLQAGSPMYFYCQLCQHLADVKPESYRDSPKKYCKLCQELKDANPDITESSLKELATKIEA
jgi:hypothetical protein